MSHTSILSVSFIETINSLVELSPEARQYIEENLHVSSFSEKETLTFNGSKSGRLCFIEQGMVKSHYQTDKELIAIGWLGWEGHFIPQSLDTPHLPLATQTFVCLEESSIAWLSREEMDRLYELHPATRRLELLVERQIRSRYDEWLRAFRLMTSGELADWLLQRYPKIGLRLSGKNISLFVGMTQEGLSKHKAKKR